MITSAGNIFEEMLGDIQPREGDKVFYRVACIKMAAPRHPRFDFIREMGFPHIDKIFSGESFGSMSLTFVFPERYMSVHEQQKMIWMLEKHPEIDRLHGVDIITSSPLVIGSFRRENIRICTWDDDHKHDGSSQA
jgi:hypothetical protein